MADILKTTFSSTFFKTKIHILIPILLNFVPEGQILSAVVGCGIGLA